MRLATSYSTPSDGDTKQVTVGTSAVRLANTETPCRIVVIKADDDNSGNIYIGFSSSVSTSNGFRLAAGQAVTIEINDLSKLWVIADSADQKVCVIWLK